MFPNYGLFPPHAAVSYIVDLRSRGQTKDSAVSRVVLGELAAELCGASPRRLSFPHPAGPRFGRSAHFSNAESTLPKLKIQGSFFFGGWLACLSPPLCPRPYSSALPPPWGLIRVPGKNSKRQSRKPIGTFLHVLAASTPSQPGHCIVFFFIFLLRPVTSWTTKKEKNPGSFPRAGSMCHLRRQRIALSARWTD